MGMFSGGGGDPGQQGRAYMANPYASALQDQMQMQALQGNLGDTGFGSAVKQGKGQIQGMMSRYGISPQSGVYQGAMSNMIGTAAAQDSQNAYMRKLQAANMQKQFVHSSDAPAWSGFGMGKDGSTAPWQAYDPTSVARAQAGPSPAPLNSRSPLRNRSSGGTGSTGGGGGGGSFMGR